MRKKFFSFVILGGVILLSSLFSDSVYADNTSITKKWLLSQYANKCVANEADSITPRTDGKVVIDSVFSSDVDGILLPSYSFNSLPSTTTCKSLLSGKNSLPSILDYKDSSLKKTKWNTDAAAAENLLTGVFKYDADEENSGGQFQIVATKTRCDKIDESGKETCDSEEVKSKVVTAEVENGTTTYSYDGVQWFNDIKIELKDHNITVKAGDFEGTCALSHDIEYTYNCLKNTLGNKSGKTVENTGNNATHTITTTYSFDVDLVLNGGNVAQYKNSSNMGGIISELNDGSNSLLFEKNEIYNLYYYYLDKALPNSGQNYRMTCSEPASTIGLTQIKLVGSSGAIENCYVNFNGTEPENIAVNIIENNTTTPTFKTGNMQDVISWFNALEVGSMIADTQPVVNSINSGTTTGGGENQSGTTGGEENQSGDHCWNAGIDSMAWILCPAERNLETTAAGLDGTVQNWLEVDTELYNSNSSTYLAWGVMRNIANIAMVIILFVVIISQVTGVGIDNYGIKKLLPKLILMAVLINLSFIICQIAVDISNILGAGLRDLFKNIGSGIAAERGTDWGELAIGDIISAMFATVGVAGAAAPIGMTVLTVTLGGMSSGGGVMVAIIVLIALLTIICAVLLFFLALGARLLIIIVCMVIAPLAFVCYILPNTKNLYKQWWKLFESALVIFPICGALSGVSYLLKKIILSTYRVHLWMLIVALIAPHLVFFLLPTLLKKAIAGLGVIGGALTAPGDAFKKGLKSGSEMIQKTDAYKDAQAAATRGYMTRKLKRLNTQDAKKGLSPTQRRRRDNLINILNKDTQDLANAQYGAQSILLSPERARANAVAERTASEISLAKQNSGLMSEQIFGIDPKTGDFANARGGFGGAINDLNDNNKTTAEKMEAQSKIQEYAKAILGEKEGVTNLARLVSGKSGAGYGALARAIKNDGKLAANVKKYGNSDLHAWVQAHANDDGAGHYKDVNGTELLEKDLNTRRISMMSQLCGDVNDPNGRGALSTSDFVSQAGGTIKENAELAVQLRNYTDLDRLGLVDSTSNPANTAQHQADIALSRMQQTAFDTLRDKLQQSNIDQDRAASMTKIISDNQLRDIYTDPSRDKYNATILSAAENELRFRRQIP